jgi:tyrosyl-tRNA synthetase
MYSSLTKECPERQVAQRILAEEVTELVHGLSALAITRTKIRVLFDQEFEQIKAKEVLDAFGEDSELVSLGRDYVQKDLVSLLVEIGICNSKCTDGLRSICSEEHSIWGSLH